MYSKISYLKINYSTGNPEAGGGEGCFYCDSQLTALGQICPVSTFACSQIYANNILAVNWE
jgi:hypothetical protein